MKKSTLKNYTKREQGGYAILFAVVIVSIISMIAIGLSNTTYKQLVLSSLANDSQVSYYQSDTATECALYADIVLGMSSTSPTPWNCGKDSSGNDLSFDLTGTGADFDLTPIILGSSSPCFDISLTKVGVAPVDTTIYARGYNSCDKTSQKTVEREIKVTY